MAKETAIEGNITALISRLSDAIVYLDKDFNIFWWNPSAASLLDLKKRHKNRPITERISHPDFEDFLKHRGDSLELELKRNTAVAVMLLSYGNSDYLLVAKDISEGYFLNKMRQDFVANVSHELRTPLTVMHGYLETLIERGKEEPYFSIFQYMQQQTQRMSDIVTDLLLLSRLEGQEVDTDNCVEINIHQLLDDVLASGLTLSNKNHIITLEINSDENVYGNVSELRSAFSNLLFNAIRHVAEKGTINLTWYKDNNHLKFSVKDNGVGISKKHIPRLTERFYRVDKGRARDAGGTGLGLAIVKHVLIRHNAKLIIESEEGKGSEFICCFSVNDSLNSSAISKV